MKNFKSLNEVSASQLKPGQYVFFATLENLSKGKIAGGTLQQAEVGEEGSPRLTLASKGEKVIIEGEVKIFPEN